MEPFSRWYPFLWHRRMGELDRKLGGKKVEREIRMWKEEEESEREMSAVESEACDVIALLLKAKQTF